MPPLPSLDPTRTRDLPTRLIAPSTGDPGTDAELALLAIAVLHSHRRAAWLRGWRAALAGRPIPLRPHEAEGWMSAFHAITWLEPAVLLAAVALVEGSVA